MATGKSLREWRRKEGLSAKALADLLGIGVNRVYKLERVERLLTAEERAALIALGAPVEPEAPPRTRTRPVKPGRRHSKARQATHKGESSAARVDVLPPGDAASDSKAAEVLAPIIRDLREQLDRLARERQVRADRMTGSPRDAAVQRLALMQLAHLRDELKLTYEEIATLLGVSGERARSLHVRLADRHRPESVS